MSRRIVVQVAAAAVVVTFAAGIWLSGDVVEASWLRFYSAAVLAALIFLWLWDNVLWRWRWVQRIPGVPRDIRGTWRGELESLWIDPATNDARPPKTVFLVVHQSAANITVILISDESRSRSTQAVLTMVEGSCSLDYMYLNVPNAKYEKRSRIHHGSASLEVAGNPAVRLNGRYWSNRDSRGQFQFSEHVTRPADDYEGALALFASGSGSTA